MNLADQLRKVTEMAPYFLARDAEEERNITDEERAADLASRVEMHARSAATAACTDVTHTIESWRYRSQEEWLQWVRAIEVVVAQFRNEGLQVTSIVEHCSFQNPRLVEDWDSIELWIKLDWRERT